MDPTSCSDTNPDPQLNFYADPCGSIWNLTLTVMQINLDLDDQLKNYADLGRSVSSALKLCRSMRMRILTLKGLSREIFCTLFISLISSSWSHLRCPGAVLIFFAFSWSYWTFKMTPQCLGHQGVDPKFLGLENFSNINQMCLYM